MRRLSLVLTTSVTLSPQLFEKSRFVGEITPASSEAWIGTPEGILCYESNIAYVITIPKYLI